MEPFFTINVGVELIFVSVTKFLILVVQF